MSMMGLITSGLGGMAFWLTTYQFGVITEQQGGVVTYPPQLPGNGVFTKPWGPLITGGLGTSACCGLILAGLGSFQCFVGVTPPDGGGGGGTGGGSIAINPGIYVPFPQGKTRKKGTHAIVITVKMNEKKWSRSFLVEDKRFKYSVKVVQFLNKTTKRVSVNVSNVQRALREVRASFRDE